MTRTVSEAHSAEVWFDGGGRVSLRPQTIPEPGTGEVRVRIVMSVLCGSELGAIRGSDQMLNAGHEAVGVVDAVGDGVQSLHVGDRVGVSAVQGCGACAACLRLEYTYCPDRIVVMGMHADYVISRALGCFPLPDDISWEQGVLVTGDGLGVPHHVAKRLGARAAAAGDDVIVFGVGPVGLGNVLMQAHLGARVTAVDVSADRLELAGHLGATNLLQLSLEEASAPATVQADLVAARIGRQPDLAIECAGRPTSLKAALASVRTNGTVVCVGEQGELPISPSVDLISRDITLLGSWFYHFAEIDDMVEQERGGLNVGRLITHAFPLDEAQNAYEVFQSGVAGKVALVRDVAEVSA